MLISETHFTNKSYIKIPNFNIYHTNHPDGTAHAGTAVMIRNNIKHYEKEGYKQENIQATSVVVQEHSSEITISSIYCPPKHNNKHKDFEHFFKTLGNNFLVGGDFNSKNVQWGSRLTNSKGRELLATMNSNNLSYLTTGQPTYWPTDSRKTPDILDFCVTKGLNTKKFLVESSLDLTSDHTPIIVTMYAQILEKPKEPSLHSKNTNWNLFRETLDKIVTLETPLKTEADIDDEVERLTKAIQLAAWQATPDRNDKGIKKNSPIIVKQKIAEKRRARKRWQTTRTESDKSIYNKKTKELRKLLQKLKNEAIQEYLKGLTATETTDYSLYKATRRLKRPQVPAPPIKTDEGNWARSNQEKAATFAKHLSKVFKPFDTETTQEEEYEINNFLDAPYQMNLPMRNFKYKEVETVIKKEINPKKAPGFDLITGKILEELPEKCIQKITHIFNAVLRVEYYPIQWKISQIIMLPKPGKNTKEVTSYRPISLIPVLSKVLEKLLLKRIKPVIEDQNIIPKHQFGFRNKHATTEQVHRLVNQINRDLETKRYCTAVFLDIEQAFDKVWHAGLCYKMKQKLPHQMYAILRSYLTHRYYFVKQQEALTNLYPISSGVPQGSVLGPVLYLIYTSDLPTTRKTTTATFADDTAILASHTNPLSASRNLQDHLNKIQHWLKKWRMKANENKSTNVTFTMKRTTCPPVTLNHSQIPQAEDAKYLGIHLDKRLTWKKHIHTKRKQLGIKFRQMYWMLGRQSELSTENKILLYKTMLKPIWTYGIPLWGSASNSNIEILQRFQSKVLRIIVNAPWYVPNTVLHKDLDVPTVREEIKKNSKKYKIRLQVHPNDLAQKLLDDEGEIRRLNRFKPSDLPTRFE
ncbi:putative RNA-directed DNA polymerase from transposon X-element [Cryptotermes secundus]|uniref:Putative RNA-directed DNA polymerase from transposon X-element n=1 Tax=Cryptotermes secundus TaxID=105785 RepID=A0A2J7PSM7_9NEOP|nr:putative RNA-directed DNA polymerase from transposon X-element [Cryptotermes secundus]